MNYIPHILNRHMYPSLPHGCNKNQTHKMKMPWLYIYQTCQLYTSINNHTIGMFYIYTRFHNSSCCFFQIQMFIALKGYQIDPFQNLSDQSFKPKLMSDFKLTNVTNSNVLPYSEIATDSKCNSCHFHEHNRRK